MQPKLCLVQENFHSFTYTKQVFLLFNKCIVRFFPKSGSPCFLKGHFLFPFVVLWKHDPLYTVNFTHTGTNPPPPPPLQYPVINVLARLTAPIDNSTKEEESVVLITMSCTDGSCCAYINVNYWITRQQNNPAGKGRRKGCRKMKNGKAFWVNLCWFNTCCSPLNLASFVDEKSSECDVCGECKQRFDGA